MKARSDHCPDMLAAATVMDRPWPVDCAMESVTCTVKLKEPVPLHVPLMVPFVASNNPGGRAPDESVHV